MNGLDTLLALTLATLVGSASWWVSVRSPATDTERQEHGLLVERRVHVDPVPCTAINDESSTTAQIWFELAPDEELLGLTTAVVYPEHLGQPLLDKGANVVFLQRSYGLDLTAFLRNVPDLRRRILHFGLWLKTSEGPELRVGWARFHSADLAESGLSIRAEPRRRTVIEVRSSNGEPVPGARVALDDDGFVPATFHCTAAADERGLLRVSGLSDGGRWIASLPISVGPARGASSQTFGADRTRVRLEIDLPGDWTYVPYELRPPHRGHPLRLQGLTTRDGEPVRVWPVSSWNGPEGWPSSSIFLMHRRLRSGPERLQLHVLGGEDPLELDLSRPGARLTVVSAAPITDSEHGCDTPSIGTEHGHDHGQRRRK